LASLTRACLFVLAVFSTLLINGCAPQSIPAVPLKKPAGIFHSVKRGENLFRIGKAYDIPHTELAAINKIEDPSKIRVGQLIFVPGATRQLPVEIITPAEPVLEHDRDGAAAERAAPAFAWPLFGRTVSGYGPRGASFHDGIDISAAEGTPIRAIAAGKVIYSDRLAGYGNIVIIGHGDGLVSVYAHNRKNLVQEGHSVGKGEIIAEVGSTGRVSGPHLHFEIRKDNRTRDPLSYLPAAENARSCASC
jgi:murein DD-endopeptidase MepM/ murein hydrolase activator NlpD